MQPQYLFTTSDSSHDHHIEAKKLFRSGVVRGGGCQDLEKAKHCAWSLLNKDLGACQGNSLESTDCSGLAIFFGLCPVQDENSVG